MKLLMRRMYNMILYHRAHIICKQVEPNVYRMWATMPILSHIYGLEVSPKGIKELFQTDGVSFPDRDGVLIINSDEWVAVGSWIVG